LISHVTYWTLWSGPGENSQRGTRRISQVVSGNEFQVAGPATEKARRPNIERHYVTVTAKIRVDPKVRSVAPLWSMRCVCMLVPIHSRPIDRRHSFIHSFIYSALCRAVFGLVLKSRAPCLEASCRRRVACITHTHTRARSVLISPTSHVPANDVRSISATHTVDRTSLLSLSPVTPVATAKSHFIACFRF